MQTNKRKHTHTRGNYMAMSIQQEWPTENKAKQRINPDPWKLQFKLNSEQQPKKLLYNRRYSSI